MPTNDQQSSRNGEAWTAEQLKEVAKALRIWSNYAPPNCQVTLGGVQWSALSGLLAKSAHAMDSLAKASASSETGLTLADVLDDYEAETRALPDQHEIPERGCSAYNWQMAVIRELRKRLGERQGGDK